MLNTMNNMTSPSVSIIHCADYDRKGTFSAINRAVGLLGGMRVFVKPGERVLIKPNLLKASPPEAAVTTHPEIVRAVIRLVREAGGTPMVGDSPGFGNLREVSAKAGIFDVVNEEGAVLVELDEAMEVAKESGRFHRFEIARAALEADAIINLPKLKTHGMTTLTGAVKNLFGCIPGKRKVQWHLNAGVNHGLFAEMLVELCALLKPRLTIMDAVIGMEGNGPGSGDPRRIGVVIAGQDPVAVDVIASRVLGVSPEKLPLIRAAAEIGYGETLSERISILGESLSNVKINHFRLPPRAHLEWKLPEWARGSLKNAFTSKPVIDNRLCIQCDVCRSHCPQKAIEQVGAVLEIRYRDCIRCFCCQEMCPQGAITVGKGWALKIVK